VVILDKSRSFSQREGEYPNQSVSWDSNPLTAVQTCVVVPTKEICRWATREKSKVGKSQDGEQQSREPHEHPQEQPESFFDRNFPTVIVVIYFIVRVGVNLFLEVVSHGR